MIYAALLAVKAATTGVLTSGRLRVQADAANKASGLAFQRAPGHRGPTWPDPSVPQQVHLDIMVEDIAKAVPKVLALGARKLHGENVFADPAGHPFCLITRPGWAEPIPAVAHLAEPNDHA